MNKLVELLSETYQSLDEELRKDFRGDNLDSVLHTKDSILKNSYKEESLIEELANTSLYFSQLSRNNSVSLGEVEKTLFFEEELTMATYLKLIYQKEEPSINYWDLIDQQASNLEAAGGNYSSCLMRYNRRFKNLIKEFNGKNSLIDFFTLEKVTWNDSFNKQERYSEWFGDIKLRKSTLTLFKILLAFEEKEGFKKYNPLYGNKHGYRDMLKFYNRVFRDIFDDKDNMFICLILSEQIFGFSLLSNILNEVSKDYPNAILNTTDCYKEMIKHLDILVPAKRTGCVVRNIKEISRTTSPYMQNESFEGARISWLKNSIRLREMETNIPDKTTHKYFYLMFSQYYKNKIGEQGIEKAKDALIKYLEKRNYGFPTNVLNLLAITQEEKILLDKIYLNKNNLDEAINQQYTINISNENVLLMSNQMKSYISLDSINNSKSIAIAKEIYNYNSNLYG